MEIQLFSKIKNKEYIDYQKIGKIDEIDKKNMYDIIKHNNYIIIDELKKKFKHHNSINLIGKGETAKYIDDAIAINQSLIFTNKKYLFINDFVSLFGIESYIKDIEYIFFPDYPHLGYMPRSIDFNYKNMIKYLDKYNFKGKIFIYQIQTTFSNIILNEFKFESTTTSDIPLRIFNYFLKINNFELYGCGIGVLYHTDLKNIDFSSIANDNKYKKYYDSYISKYYEIFNDKTTNYLENDMKNRMLKIGKVLDIKLNFN